MISRQGSQLNRLRDADALVISFRQFGQCGFMSLVQKEFNAGAVTGAGDPGPSRARCRRASRLRCVRADRRKNRGQDAGAAGCGTGASADALRARSAWGQARYQSRRAMRAERTETFTGPADGPNTTNAQKPSHNATPVQTRVVVMMCSRENRQESLAVICANQGSPEEYGSRLQI